MQKKWWEKEPLRIFEVASFLADQVASPERLLERIASFHPNSQHAHFMMYQPSAGGLSDDDFLFKTSLASRPNPELLGPYLAEARRRGIRVIVYFNVHWYSPAFAEKHPDWVQITEGGTPKMDLYGFGAALCVNTPWREWSLQVIRDLARYEIDGVFLDGPIFQQDTCYCQYCQARFKERYGQQIPPKSQRNHPHFPLLVEFQSDSIASFLASCKEALQQTRPEALIYMNSQPVFKPSWTSARSNRELVPHQDMLGAEGGFIHADLNLTPIWKPGATAKLLETQAAGKPTIIFDFAGHLPWAFYLLTEPEIRLLHAQTIANGANVWLAVFPDDLDQPQLQAVKDFNLHVERNPDAYHDTLSLARVALLHSEQSVTFYPRAVGARGDSLQQDVPEQAVGSFELCFRGLYDALSRSQVPFDVIDDQALLDSTLSRYKLLVLPNCPCLSDAQVGALKDFVYRGGNLVASFLTSCADEIGRPRDTLGLCEVLGVEAGTHFLGPFPYDYVAPATAHPLLKGITKRWFPAPGWGIRAECGSAVPVLVLCEKLKGVYQETPAPTSLPAVTFNSYGKGKAIYLAGTFGETYYNYHFQEYRRIVDNAAELLAGRQVLLEGVPRSVDVSLRAAKDHSSAILHLTNFTGALSRPLEEIVALGPISVTVLLDEFSPTTARALRLGRELPLETKGNAVSFSLPRLEEYEAIVLEGGQE